MSVVDYRYINLGVAYGSFVSGEQPGDLSFDDNGVEYVWNGSTWIGLQTANNPMLLTQGLVDANGAPKTTRTAEQPYYLENVLTPASMGAVATTDLTKLTMSGSDVDGIIVQAIKDQSNTAFDGYWVAVSTTDLSDAAAATRLSSVTSGNNSLRYWCPVGEATFIPLPSLAYVWVISVDAATEDNKGMVYPV